MDDPLKDIFDKPRPTRSNGCPVCGDPVAANVIVRIRVLGDTGTPSGNERSRSRSLCAKHAAEVYNTAVDLLERSGKDAVAQREP